MNQRMRRKHLKRVYRTIIKFIEVTNKDVKYQFKYLPKTSHHDDYVMIQAQSTDDFARTTYWLFDMGFNNELIDYTFPNEDVMTHQQKMVLLNLVDYFTSSNRSWKIGKALTLY